MDVVIASDMSESFAPYAQTPRAERATPTQRALKMLAGLLVSGVAASLSWQCNSRMGYSLAMRVLSALLAFMFGGVYLMYYVLVRSDVCRVASK